MADTDYHELFIKHCPLIYFHKDEPYLPASFDDILNVSKITKTVSGTTYDGIQLKDVKVQKDVDNNTLILIDKNKKYITKDSMGKQILCRTNGIWSVTKNNNNNEILYTDYIDLVYIVTFTWNGTLEPHAFDKEEIVVRLIRNSNKIINNTPINTWIPFRVFGSAHGYGKWYNYDNLDFDTTQNKFIMYSALESHAMYSDILVHKRLFGFGNDITKKDILWSPSEFVVFDVDMKDVNVYNNDNIKISASDNTKFFLYNGQIGDEKDKQWWGGSMFLTNTYDTNNLDGWLKFGGGLADLFDGKRPQVSPTIRNSVKIVSGLILLGLLIFIIKHIITYKKNNKYIALFVILYIVLFILMFASSTFIGLELFVFNN